MKVFGALLGMVAVAGAAYDQGATDTTGVAFEAAGQTYTPTTNVAAHQGMSTKVCSIKGSLGDANWAGYKAEYVSSGLQALAQETYTGTTNFDMFKAYYGTANFVDAYVLAALDGTDGWTDDDARYEAIEKGLMDQTLVKAALGHLDSALMSGDSATASAHLDSVFAFYVGRMDGCSPYARATKRAGNFDKWAADGETALTNVRFMENLVAAKAKAQAGQSFAAEGAEIVAAIQTIYIQASLRYLAKLDNDNKEVSATAEHQGEGWAFWRVVEPYFASEVASALVTATYNVANVPSGVDHYCTGLSVMMDNLPARVTAANVGVLEDTEDAGCITTKNSVHTHTGVTYTLQSIVNPAMGMSTSVCKIKSLLGEGKIDYVENVYVREGLQSLANEDNDNDVTEIYQAYFQSETWIDDMIMSAIKGQDGWTSVEAQKEGIEKGVMDQALVHGVILKMSDSVTYFKAGNQAAALHAWDSAFALYVGHNDGCAPYARAVKRAANYGTYAATGEPDALANEHVLLALKAGQKAIMDNKSPEDEADAVMDAMAVTYYQATLRYLHKMDNDVAEDLPFDEHRGEGKAFWHVVAPVVAQSSSKGASMIDGFYNLFKDPTAPRPHYMFCEGREILTTTLPGDVPVSAFGILEDTEDIDCDAPPPENASPASPTAAGASPTAAPSENSAATGLQLVSALLTAWAMQLLL